MKIGILSDIHEDIESLQTAIEIFDSKKCDFLVCLGDIVGYSFLLNSVYYKRDIENTIISLRSNFKYIVSGNHDLHAIQKLPDNSQLMGYPDNWYSMNMEQRKIYPNKLLWLYQNENPVTLSTRAFEFINAIPEYRIYNDKISKSKDNNSNFANKNIMTSKILFSHFIQPYLTGSIQFFPKLQLDYNNHFEFMKKNKAFLSFVGHLHFSLPVVITENSSRKLHIGFNELEQKVQYIFIPNLVYSLHGNIICIYDSNDNILEVIRLQKYNNFRNNQVYHQL